jgi:hypothetical protein
MVGMLKGQKLSQGVEEGVERGPLNLQVSKSAQNWTNRSESCQRPTAITQPPVASGASRQRAVAIVCLLGGCPLDHSYQQRPLMLWLEASTPHIPTGQVLETSRPAELARLVVMSNSGCERVTRFDAQTNYRCAFKTQ